MDKNERKIWNENHKLLKSLIQNPEQHHEAVQLFLAQHASLHDSSIKNKKANTLHDALVYNLEEDAFRAYPITSPDTKNSIAWHLWHIIRIEDMAVNILIANAEQVHNPSWQERLGIEFSHSGNDMSEEEITVLSSQINFNELLAYRAAVGERTQKVISKLCPGDFLRKVEPKRIKRLFEVQAVMPKSSWLTDYWNKKTIAG